MQLGLMFAAPLSRKSDPETSHVAAEKSASFTSKQEARIFGAIFDAGERGATAKEIAARTDMTDVQVNRRLSKMGERGVIKRKLKADARSWRDFESRDGCAIWWKT